MKKIIKRAVVALSAFAMLLSQMTIPAKAESLEGRSTKAYLAYADAAWTYQNWGAQEDETTGIKVTAADINGDGDYTVGLDFTGTEAGKAEGLAFSAVIIDNGKGLFPNAVITVNEVKVNGEAIDVAKTYTSSDDGKELRSNLYNEWVTELPVDAKTADGDLTDATPKAVSVDAFASVETVEVSFSVSSIDTLAYIMYADADWAVQYWGSDAEGVVANNAIVTGDGSYTVSLDFTGSANGFANSTSFAALGIKNFDNVAAGACITIDEVKVNGEAVEVGKYYTSSDDKIETRVNLYNEWVTEVPADARRADGDLDGATPQPISKDVFGEVKTIEVSFTVSGATPTAYIMYADEAWGVQYWGSDAEGVAAKDVVVTGEGEYTVSLDFTSSANGYADKIAFMALGIKNGEKIFPGWTYDIVDLKLNGESVEVGKYYTSSDDGIETRVNLYNEWVTELPADARRTDGDTADATPIPVAKDLFGEVKTIELTFAAHWGAAPVVETEKEEVVVEYSGNYNAFLGVQTNTELWIFRNAWADENYGANATPEIFAGLYDTTTETMHDGTFTDAVITGDGTYTVSLNGADFGSENYMSQLFVSFDIPYSSSIAFSDVEVKVNGKSVYTTAEGYIPEDSKAGDYLTLSLQNIWDSNVTDLFPIMFPVTDIEVTFTISGLGYTGEAVEPAVEAPTETSVEAPATEASVEAPAEESAGVPAWIWVIIAVVVIGAVAAIVVASKKKGNKEEK